MSSMITTFTSSVVCTHWCYARTLHYYGLCVAKVNPFTETHTWNRHYEYSYTRWMNIPTKGVSLAVLRSIAQHSKHLLRQPLQNRRCWHVFNTLRRSKVWHLPRRSSCRLGLCKPAVIRPETDREISYNIGKCAVLLEWRSMARGMLISLLVAASCCAVLAQVS